MNKFRLSLLGAALLFSTNAFALSVTTTNNADILANTILGSGITLVGSATYTGASGASGTFTSGGNIGINNGIILTTGSAVGAMGPNNVSNYSVNNGASGMASLSALAGGSTQNAAKLSFDFTTAGGNLFFKYVFGSEEYNEYVNSAFNDVFAFFLDGNNIALIPGTSTAVAINNVNLGKNSAYYRNNASGQGYDTQYDGLTTVLTANALGLSAGTHHIDIAIADTGDTILDSGVFIQGGSFSDTNTVAPVPEPGTVILLGAGLAGLCFLTRRAKN